MKIKSIASILFIGTALAANAYGLTPNADERMQTGMTIAERVFSSEDPETAIQNLEENEQQILKELLTPGPLEVETEIIAAPQARAFSGCWAMRTKAGRKALFGNTIYTYWQTTEVCVRDGNVTSVSITEADGETSTPGWRIAHAPTTATKNVGWEGRGIAKYYFVLGAGSWDIQHPTDCLQLRLNANGSSYRSMTDCSLDAP